MCDIISLTDAKSCDKIGLVHVNTQYCKERHVECLIPDRGVMGSGLTGSTGLCP